jgi:hypothetical protein
MRKGGRSLLVLGQLQMLQQLLWILISSMATDPSRRIGE